jgi:RNA polymerase sigma-70 factor (ECF subfamily)
MYSLSMETYRPRLRRTALRLVRNESDADDIVQEAFARWYASPPRDTHCPEAWLVTVVRRLCVDAHRSKKKEFPCDADALGRALTAKPVELDRALVQEDEIAIALHHLSERATTEECVALILREGFAYSYPELARVLSKSEEACRQLVHRGKCAAQGLRPPRRPASTLSNQLLAVFLNALRECNIAGTLSILAQLTASSRPG